MDDDAILAEPLKLQFDAPGLLNAYASGIASEDPTLAVRAKSAADKVLGLGGGKPPSELLSRMVEHFAKGEPLNADKVLSRLGAGPAAIAEIAPKLYDYEGNPAP